MNTDGRVILLPECAYMRMVNIVGLTPLLLMYYLSYFGVFRGV